MHASYRIQHNIIINTHTSSLLPSYRISSLKDSLQKSESAVSDAQHTIATSLSEQKESLITAQRAELSLYEETLRTQHLRDLEELRSELSVRHQVRTLHVLFTYCTIL